MLAPMCDHLLAGLWKYALHRERPAEREKAERITLQPSV